jgi:acyl-CoA thioester hydrolase
MTALHTTEPHRMAMRVYYEDTDAAGIVYYANYLKFAERGRTEMLRSLGFGHRKMREETGVVFTVRRCAVEYHAPARLDDLLTVETRIEAIGGATLALRQLVSRDTDTLATLDVLVACAGDNGRARRVPPELRALLAGKTKPSPSPSIVQKTP